MRRMSLSNRAEGGKEKLGMVAIYLLCFDNGEYFMGWQNEQRTLLLTTLEWSRATFYFGLNGLLELRKVRDKFGGTIMIVNAFLPECYYNQ